MGFSDEQLKRLKEEVHMGTWTLRYHALNAILHRLECAEKALFSERCPNCPDQGFWVQESQGVAEQFQCGWCETTPNSRFLAEIAWRKSKGE